MKVLFLTNTPAPYRVLFFNELGKKCELTVLYENNVMEDRNKIWYSEKAKNYTEKFLKGFHFKGRDIRFNIIKELSDTFDFIILGGAYSSPTTMIAVQYLSVKKIPFMVCVDGGIVKKDSKFVGYIKKYFMSKASAWLSTGKVTDLYLINYGADKKRIYHYPFTSLMGEDIITNLILPEEKNQIKKKINIKEDKVIISVGQFIHRKGFDVLLRSCEKFGKDIGIYIIGGEPNQEYLNLKEVLGLTNVHFVGFKSKEDLVEYYKAADLFVLPTRFDPWGLVVQEAMAFGLPVITTDKCIAGLELIMDYENGFIVPVENEIILSNRIIEVLSKNDLKSNMSLNNLEKILGYTIEIQGQRFIDIFNNFNNSSMKEY